MKSISVRRERHLELDEICTSFEKAWKGDDRKSIEAYVAQVSDAMKPIVVRELVSLECELRSELGEVLSRGGYLGRFPGFKDEAEAGFDDWFATSDHSETITTDDVQTPERYGDYRIVRQIGQGGMGIVYEAIQESLARTVAIKTLASHPLHVPKSALRFRRESRAVARLHHTNIIQVYGSGVHDGIPYFAMQFIDGKSLDNVVREAIACQQSMAADCNSERLEHRLLGSEAYLNIARIGAQVSSALQYAHENGVLHRDIKPSNLLIDEKGTTWVSDFGLAKLRRQSDQTISGEIIGTLRYAPPEIFGGSWSESGDVYSLGLTLYELATLQPAFSEEDHGSLIERITQGDAPKRPRRINPNIPRDLETIILKSIARNSRNRYQTAAELSADLECFIKGLPISARPISITEKTMRWVKRRPLTASLAACVFALVAVGFPLTTTMWLSSENTLEMLRAEGIKTEIARKEAILANKLANQERLAALHAEYASDMQLAQKFIEEKRIEDTGSLLNKWNTESRNSRQSIGSALQPGWEWNFVHQQIDTSQMTLQGSLPYVYDVQISPNDQQIATVHTAELVSYEFDKRSEVIVWNSNSGQPEFTLDEPEGIFTSVAFKPDGSELTTIAIDTVPNNNIRGYLRTWGAENGQLLHSVELSGEFDKNLLTKYVRPDFYKVHYSDDGQRILTSPSPVEVRDSETLEVLWSRPGRQGTFVCDTDVALIGDQRQIQIYNSQGKLLTESDSLPEFSFDIAATHDCQQISVRAEDNLLLMAPMNTSSGTRLKTINEFHCDQLFCGKIAKSGNVVSYNDYGGRVFIENRRNAKWYSKTYLGHSLTVTCSDFSSDEKWMVTSSLDGTAKIWDLERSVEKKVYETGKEYCRMSDFCFSPDGNRVNYVCRKLKNYESGETQYNAGSFNYDRTPSKQCNVDVTCSIIWPRTDFAISPDGKFLLAPVLEQDPFFPNRNPANTGQMGIWFVEDWSLVCKFDVPFKEINSAAWNRDLNTVVVAGKNATAEIAIYNAQEMLPRVDDWTEASYHQPVHHFTFKDDRVVKALAFDRAQLAVARQQEVTVIDLADHDSCQFDDIESLKHKSQFHLKEGANPKFLDFSPDGKRLGVALKGLNIGRIYDIEHGEAVFELDAPREVCCIRFSPNGRRFALSGYDGLVYLCDSETGNRLLNLAGSSHAPTNLPINSRVVFSSDGRKIATNTKEGSIVVWEANPISENEADTDATNNSVSTSNSNPDAID